MKKALLLLLTLVLALSLLAGCTGGEGTTGGKEPSTPTPPASSTTQPGLVVPPEIETITIAEALELCAREDNDTEVRHYLLATVDAVTNAQYGAMVLKDETGTISVYNSANEDGTVGYAQMTEKPVKGDQVLVYCTLHTYNGNPEIQSAWIVDFAVGKPDVNEADYTQMSVLEARNAESGALVKVSGVVAQITYAFGQVPTAFYLVDGTNAILVHGKDIAQQVKVGNQITVLASKAWWILESESNNAATYGYKGSCQLENAYLISNDNKTDNVYDKSWIRETTVTDIMNTPVSENITTSIFKVNALVKKQEGTGFVNYYFYDIDGTTGSYAYTQCSGSDFAWLDAFDGKICTVYLSVINAKSTTSGCIFRLQPIEVIDEGYQFDLSKAPEFVANRYGISQFESSYTGDPGIELITSVSSELLGFENAALSYTSSDPTVVKIEEVDGKLYLHCIRVGTATVTVTASHNGTEFSVSKDITVGAAEVYDSLTVKDAIDTPEGEVIIIKGIVGPSLVNQSGFYLIDDTGVIAVLTDSKTVLDLKIGNEIIIEGTRSHKVNDNVSCFGQTYINNATVLSNFYGNTPYATEHFVTDKTITEIYELDDTQDFTTTVFVVTATVKVVRNPNYTNIFLSDGNKDLRLYCSNAANQYGWLVAFEGQEVTVEVAACNWNSKSYYTGCVLAVRTEDGKVYNELNFY